MEHVRLRGWKTDGHSLGNDILFPLGLKCVDGCYKNNIEYNYIRDLKTNEVLFIIEEDGNVFDNFMEHYEKYKIQLRVDKINKIRQ